MGHLWQYMQNVRKQRISQFWRFLTENNQTVHSWKVPYFIAKRVGVFGCKMAFGHQPVNCEYCGKRMDGRMDEKEKMEKKMFESFESKDGKNGMIAKMRSNLYFNVLDNSDKSKTF